MMYKSLFLRLGALAGGMLLAAAAVAQNKPAAPAASTAAASAAAPTVAEPADRLLKELGAYIGSAQEFTFHADVTFDHCAALGPEAAILRGRGSHAASARPALRRMERRPRRAAILV